MTVAIGAICDDGQTVVVAADRMITYGPPLNVQSETASLKTNKMTDYCLALCAGLVSDGEEILRLVKAQPMPATIREIGEAVKTHYGAHKIKRVEEIVLRPTIGGGYQAFQQMMIASTASHLLIQIGNFVFNHNLGLDILIAGVDAAGASLWGVTHPGTLHSVNQIGYAATGSGGSFATARLGLGGQSRTLTLAQTIHNVYEAKRAAELGPGVGRLTDMAVIKSTGIKYLPDDFLSHLDTLHQRVSVLAANESTAIQARYDGLP